jgi:hypothetical protein
LIAGASLAGAESSSPDTSRHLLVVPESARGELALARADARVVAHYENFTLVEATGDDVDNLRSAGAGRRDDMRAVLLAGGELDPRSGPRWPRRTRPSEAKRSCSSSS